MWHYFFTPRLESNTIHSLLTSNNLHKTKIKVIISIVWDEQRYRRRSPTVHASAVARHSTDIGDKNYGKEIIYSYSQDLPNSNHGSVSVTSYQKKTQSELEYM